MEFATLPKEVLALERAILILQKQVARCKEQFTAAEYEFYEAVKANVKEQEKQPA